MVMGACPGQIPISCVPLTLMVTAAMVRACRYMQFDQKIRPLSFRPEKFDLFTATLFKAATV